ncbi:MAG: class I SAM-dependent methyltransferase [Bacteroidia bacterium]|nr:class I SAM-dependent methyltransferase [Bacteroidia bacterium]
MAPLQGSAPSTHSKSAPSPPHSLLESEVTLLRKRVSQLNELHPVVRHYWNHQFRLGWEVLVPFLSKERAFRPGMAVAEIGCAEGGVLMAFAVAGALNPVGTDIDPVRLQEGEKIATHLGLPVVFTHHDILQDFLPENWVSAFDLVVLRDVIEHLENTAEALRRIHQLLKPGGHVFFSFPPYPSPYGGHQHALLNFWGKLPYIHLLPEHLFEKMAASGWEAGRAEIFRLRKIRLSLPHIPSIAKQTGFEIVREKHYLLRPVFRYRLGLPIPSVSLPDIAKRFPSIAQFFCTEAGFLLRKNR